MARVDLAHSYPFGSPGLRSLRVGQPRYLVGHRLARLHIQQLEGLFQQVGGRGHDAVARWLPRWSIPGRYPLATVKCMGMLAGAQACGQARTRSVRGHESGLNTVR